MIRHFKDYSLLHHNTFGIAAKAADFYEYETEEELELLVKEGRLRKPLLHIGGGSNLLFTRDFEGSVLHSRIVGREVVEEDTQAVFVRVGAGENWDDLVAWTVAQGWSGAENLSLIPGEVGASAIQNIGAYGMEAKDLVARVEAVEIATGKRRVFTNAECQYAYRNSVFKGELRGRYAVTRVVYRLSKAFVPRLDYGRIREALPANIEVVTPQSVRQAVIGIRKSKLPDPRETGNAGSFFVNPIVSMATYRELKEAYPLMPHYETGDGSVKIPAGWLIEQCGWKGRELGRAGVYERQALVLVNRGGATGKDIMRLCAAIQQDVNTRFGIEIQPEVNII